MARQIASTVETTDEELSYFDTANLHGYAKRRKDMAGEENSVVCPAW